MNSSRCKEYPQSNLLSGLFALGGKTEKSIKRDLITWNLLNDIHIECVFTLHNKNNNNSKIIMFYDSFIFSYRPDLVDLSSLKGCSIVECNERAFTIIEREMGIPRIMDASDSATLENVDSKLWLNYLEQVCEVFRGEIPHVKHPKLVRKHSLCSFVTLHSRTFSKRKNIIYI